LEDQGKNSGRTAVSKGQLENTLGSFNIMMPDQAFDKFWATVASPSATSVSIASFLSKTRPDAGKGGPIRPAGVRIITVPLGEESEKKKRLRLFNWDTKELGPIPTWDNEWR